MSTPYEKLSHEEQNALLEKACEKAGEVLGDAPYVLIGCTLGSDGFPNGALPVSATMNDEQIVDLVTSLARAFSSAEATEPVTPKTYDATLASATSKADRVWLEMRKNLDGLKRMAVSYPHETAGDRLVRDCIFLVYTKVLEGMQSAN